MESNPLADPFDIVRSDNSEMRTLDNGVLEKSFNWNKYHTPKSDCWIVCTFFYRSDGSGKFQATLSSEDTGDEWTGYIFGGNKDWQGTAIDPNLMFCVDVGHLDIHDQNTDKPFAIDIPPEKFTYTRNYPNYLAAFNDLAQAGHGCKC